MAISPEFFAHFKKIINTIKSQLCQQKCMTSSQKCQIIETKASELLAVMINEMTSGNLSSDKQHDHLTVQKSGKRKFITQSEPSKKPKLELDLPVPDLAPSTSVITHFLSCFDPNCTFLFASTSDLYQHQVTHHGINPYFCPVPECGLMFQQLSFLKDHVTWAHANVLLFPCQVCSGQFYGLEAFLEHDNQDHLLGHFACAKVGCNFIANTRGQVLHHLEIHSMQVEAAPLQIQLTSDQVLLPFQNNLTSDLQNLTFQNNLTAGPPMHLPFPPHVIQPKTQVTLDPANSNRTNVTTMSKVTRKVSDEAKFKLKFVKCTVEECNEFVIRFVDLKDHLKKCHNLKPNCCLENGCRKTFDKRAQLREHITAQHPSAEPKCSKCNLLFDGHSQLLIHDVRYHIEGNYHCTFYSKCNFSSKYQGPVIEHYNKVHI